MWYCLVPQPTCCWESQMRTLSRCCILTTIMIMIDSIFWKCRWSFSLSWLTKNTVNDALSLKPLPFHKSDDIFDSQLHFRCLNLSL